MHVASTDFTVNLLAMFVDNARMTVRTGRGGSPGTQLCCMNIGVCIYFILVPLLLLFWSPLVRNLFTPSRMDSLCLFAECI